MNPDQRIREEALTWASRVTDPDFAGWEDFTAWLEQDPAHAQAYDAVQFAVNDAVEALSAPPAPLPAPDPVAANDNPPARWLVAGRGRWFGAAIAASLVLFVTFMLWPATPKEVLYATAPGETRLIALADGSTVELGGASRIAISGKDERQARLDAGQALFTIRHDESNPFTLAVGTQKLVDVGTVFDVRIRPAGLDLAVSEGAVMVNPEKQAITVDAGKKAVLANGAYTLSAIDPAEVGEWSRGRMTLREASPAEVAAELSRATGITFAAEGADAGVRLSGSIALDQVRADPRSLEAILGMKVRRDGARWILSAR
jgi:transmembrane sensor